jgi:hypothetical protein
MEEEDIQVHVVSSVKNYHGDYMGSQIGYDFENEGQWGLTHYHIVHEYLFYHKLPDTHLLRSTVRKVKNMYYTLPPQFQKALSFVMKSFVYLTLPKQPGDFFLIYRGAGGIWEFKASKQRRLYPSVMIADHQVRYANHIEVYGDGFYYYLICCRIIKGDHFVIVLNREEMREALIEENERMMRGDIKGFNWDELFRFSHLPVIYANKKKELKEGEYFTKWDWSPIFKDIRDVYGME